MWPWKIQTAATQSVLIAADAWTVCCVSSNAVAITRVAARCTCDSGCKPQSNSRRSICICIGDTTDHAKGCRSSALQLHAPHCWVQCTPSLSVSVPAAPFCLHLSLQISEGWEETPNPEAITHSTSAGQHHPHSHASLCNRKEGGESKDAQLHTVSCWQLYIFIHLRPLYHGKNAITTAVHWQGDKSQSLQYRILHHYDDAK